MLRRDFLGKFARPAALLAAVPVVATAADRAHAATQAALHRLTTQFTGMQAQCTSLRERVDHLEARQKKLVRVALAGAAVLVGVDVSLLL